MSQKGGHCIGISLACCTQGDPGRAWGSGHVISGEGDDPFPGVKKKSRHFLSKSDESSLHLEFFFCKGCFLKYGVSLQFVDLSIDCWMDGWIDVWMYFFGL